MPRKGSVAPRVIGPDPVFENVVVHRLINKVMTRGKKGLAARSVYKAFEMIR
jgi:small subunit ribosomal protein S7